MDKKAIGEIKRQFKCDNKKTKLSKLVSTYVAQGNTILSTCTQEFESMDSVQQELFFTNFKKSLGNNLYELSFNREVDKPCEQQLFLNELFRGYNQEGVQTLIEKIIANFSFDDAYIINILFGEYHKPPKKKKGEEPLDFAPYRFMICTFNLVLPPTKAVYFNPKNNEVGVTPNILKEIGLKAPFQGFLFPAYEDFSENINNVMYFEKSKDIDSEGFISNVLGCKMPLSLLQEQLEFKNLLSAFISEAEGVNVINQIYKELNTLNDTKGPDTTLNADQLADIFIQCGVNVEKDTICETYESVLGTHILTVSHIIHQGKVQIVSNDLNIKFSQDILDQISFVTDSDGNKSLVVAIEDSDILLDDITIHPIDTES